MIAQRWSIICHKDGRRWSAYLIKLRDGTYHIVPKDDAIAHEVTDCICGPTPHLNQDAKVGDIWIYTHWAIDGREVTPSPST